MMLMSCGIIIIFLAIAIAGPLLLAIGLIGRRNLSMPRCRACRHPLADSAVIPEACPVCRASLAPKRAVAFGGWRMARRPFFVGLVLTVVAGALAGAGGFLTTRSARMQFVNGVVIEQSVSDARFAERTATLDDDAWSWMLAHQEANVLTPELERRVVEHVLASVAAGTATTEQLRSLSGGEGAFEKSKLADAMVDGLGEPALQVTYGRQRLTLAVDASARTQPFLHGPCTPVLAITAVRLDDVPVQATTPLGRVAAGTAWLRSDFELPPTTGTGARRVEVDLVWAVYDEVPESIRDGLPGPVESWPTPLALRKLTMVVEGAGDDDER